MSKDTLIFVAFCVFAFLVGMRMKQRWSDWKKKKQPEERISKNQRPKAVPADEPPEVKARRLRREGRVRFFTIAHFFAGRIDVLYGSCFSARFYAARTGGCDEYYFTLFDLCIHYLHFYSGLRESLSPEK